jgi:hypothetical protein
MPVHLKQILIFCAIYFGCLRLDCRRILHRDHFAGYAFFGTLLLYCSSLFCLGACIGGNIVCQGKSIENRACRASLLAADGKSVVVKGRTGTSVLCSYPEHPRYIQGDINRADSYSCAARTK